MNSKEGITHINGVDIYHKIAGKGEPLVILHGGPGLGHQYLYPYFGKLTHYKLIFYDQRSCGKSSGDENPSKITVDTFVDDLEALRKWVTIEKMNVIGHSWGGLLALHYALQYPNNVKTLTLFGSPAASSEYNWQMSRNREKRLSEETKRELIHLVASTAFKNCPAQAFKKFFALESTAFFYDKSLADTSFYEYLTDDMARKMILTHQMLGDYLNNYDIYGRLSQILCPTLIMYGDYDPVPLEGVRRIHECIRGSQFVLLKECGHLPYIEKPEQFFKVLEDFLEDHIG